MADDTVRPEYCTEEMLEYLDELRESGVTNMFGAARYLDEVFQFHQDHPSSFHSSPQARAVLAYWMQTFTERHSEN